MTLRVAINGFGRTGRTVFREGYRRNMDFVAISSRTNGKVLPHLLKYDSTYGIFNAEIEAKSGSILTNGKEIKILSGSDPAKLPWNDLDVDIVIESTGVFRDRESASKHLEAGAKKVIITAPAKNPDVVIAPGVNDEAYDKNHEIISLASCTTNCLAPVAKVLHEGFGIQRGFMTTVHAYTGDQRLLDGSHRDLRRARSAAVSIVPTTTGATTATEQVLPELKGRLDGIAMRVPVPTGSIVDFVADLERSTNVEEVNDAFEEVSRANLKGILDISYEPLVSVDYIGNPHSAIVDGMSTSVIGDNLVKVLAWYDNEWGYSCRVVDMLEIIHKKGL